MVIGLAQPVRLLHEPECFEFLPLNPSVAQKEVVHPGEQGRAGLPDELMFKARKDGVLTFAVVEEIETELFGFRVPLPVKAFFVFHDQIPRGTKI
jgi:hypothetical protein